MERLFLLLAVLVPQIFSKDVKNMLYASIIFIMCPFPLSQAHQKSG